MLPAVPFQPTRIAATPRKMRTSASLLPSLPTWPGFMGGPLRRSGVAWRFRRTGMISCPSTAPSSAPGAQVVAHDVLAEPARVGCEDPAAVARGEVLHEVDQ